MQNRSDRSARQRAHAGKRSRAFSPLSGSWGPLPGPRGRRKKARDDDDDDDDDDDGGGSGDDDDDDDGDDGRNGIHKGERRARSGRGETAEGVLKALGGSFGASSGPL